MKYFLLKRNNMKKQYLGEILLSIVLIVLAIGLLDPFMLLMPGEMAMTVMLLLVLLFVIYTVFFWKERVQDEREEMHRLLVGRLAWLSGSSILILGIVWQGFIIHKVDPWLVLALSVMVLTKMLGRIYGEKNY